MEITGGSGVDIAMDAAPADTGVIGHAIELVRSGDTVVAAGVKGGTNMATLDTDRMVYKEITMKGMFTQGADMYRAGIDLLARNLERLAPMHTHTMLEDTDRAIRMRELVERGLERAGGAILDHHALAGVDPQTAAGLDAWAGGALSPGRACRQGGRHEGRAGGGTALSPRNAGVCG